MSLNQDSNRFLGASPTIPPLPLLHPRRPERRPPAIPLRQFRSNPTHFPATRSQALQSGDSESGHLGSPTSEIGEARKLPFFSWRSWPWQSDTVKDRLELYLEQFQSLDSRIADLQHDYSRFKNKPSPELFEVFLQLVHINVFKPLPNQPHIQHSSDQRQNPLQTNCWSDFRSDLKIGEGGVLTVCMISFTVNDKIRKLFSFKDKIFITDASRLRRKYKSLSLSALIIVAEEWSLPKNVLEACFGASRFQRRMFTPFTTFKTKHKAQFTEFTLNKLDWISMEFCWHSKVPEYKRSLWDFDIYIWRPQVDRPERERVKLFIKGASDSGWQLLMIWKPTERASTGMLDRYTQQRVKQLQEQFDSPHSNETEIISSLFSIYTLIINDTETFLDSLVDEIANLTLEGRRKPTASKINFLLHLDDHRQESCIGLRDASTVLEEISTWMNANPDRLNAEYGLYKKLHRWCKQIRRDLKRLQDALLEIKEPLANVQAMTKDQIDLHQITLTAILTFLAAIYLPFSLISGMFGMNVKDPLFPSTSKPLNDSVSSSQTSTATLALRTSGQLFAAHIAHRAAVDTTGAATTSSTSSATEATSGSNFSQEQTDAIVSAIMETSSSPSPHLWSFAQFLYISFALSATTIILPIIAGPIFRVTLRSFYQYKVYWRLAVLVFVLSSNIVLDVYIPPLPFEVVFGAPQVAFSLYKLAQARLRGRQKKRWTGYATLLGVCIAIDETAPGSFGTKKLIHYSQNVGLVAFLPPLYLFAIWMQRDPPMLSNSRLLSWKARLPFMKLSWRQKARPHKSRHLRICLRIFTVCVITGLNAMLSIFLPGVTYAIATSIPFGLFALDKLLPPMGKRMNLRGILQWYIFLTVVATSAVFQAIGFADLIGISALLPSVYLWMLYYGQDQIKAWFFQRGRGLNGSQLPSQMSD